MEEMVPGKESELFEHNIDGLLLRRVRREIALGLDPAS